MDDKNEKPDITVLGQKRVNPETDGPESKRANIAEETGNSSPKLENDPDKEVQIKVLIPNVAVGPLIGRGGDSMHALEKDSGCRIRIHQDRFPDTDERVCTVKGKVTSMMMVMNTILERIQEKRIDSRDPFDLKGIDRRHEMKLVVPNLSVGAVIGSRGASIEEIRHSTGANIRIDSDGLSRNSRQFSERVITVGADKTGSILDAIQRMLVKLANDPVHAREVRKLETEMRSSRDNYVPRRSARFDDSSTFGGGRSNPGPTQNWRRSPEYVPVKRYSNVSNFGDGYMVPPTQQRQQLGGMASRQQYEEVPGHQQGRPQNRYPPQQVQVRPMVPQASLESNLPSASPEAIKQQLLGEILFPIVSNICQDKNLSGIITGTMLEMDKTDIIALLGNRSLLQRHVEEAVSILHQQPFSS